MKYSAMNREEMLRQACKVVGVDYTAWIFHYPTLPPLALPAYVAELLVAKAIRDGLFLVEHGAPEPGFTTARVLTDPEAPGGGVTLAYIVHKNGSMATILAAMVALGKMTLEQAREVE